MKISKKSIKQYILIYFMLLMNQSVIRDSFFTNDYISFGILVAIAIFYAFYRNKYIMRFMFCSLALCAITRLLVGGVGIGIWISWMTMILVTYSAIKVEENQFLNRIVKTITFFAAISVVLWLVSLVNIDFVQKMMLFHYKMRTNFARHYIDSVRYDKIFYDAYGGLLYCVNMCHPRRNCGIFTEPGVYQMILNSGIFVLVYMKDYVFISEKKRTRYIFLLALTVLTTQSTTGVLSLIMIFGSILLRKNTPVFKKLLMGGICVGIIVFGQYIWQGENSFLYTTIIKKLFTSTGFSLSASSGAARMGTIAICILSMIKNPLGIGYDGVTVLLNSEVTGYVAASIFVTGAACGVVMFLLILSWVIVPVVLTKLLDNCGKFVFIFIYFNTILSQSSEFYPFLIFVPIILIQLARNKQTLKNTALLQLEN